LDRVRGGRHQAPEHLLTSGDYEGFETVGCLLFKILGESYIIYYNIILKYKYSYIEYVSL
jgi:hypothetical protein